VTIPFQNEDAGRSFGLADQEKFTKPEDVIPGKVLLGWLAQPVAGTLVLQQRFFDSFYNFIQYDLQQRKVYAGYQAIGTGYIPQGRNEMMTLFLQNRAEWLLSLDWDISFDREAVYALLDVADPIERPIVAGCYLTWFGKDSHLRPCAMTRKGNLEYVPMDDLVVGAVTEVSMVGMGFTLIHRSVLEKMFEVYKHDPWQWFGHDIVGDGRTGEDLTFCDRARKCGFSVWLHGGVQLGHVKSKTIFLDDVVNPYFGISSPKSRAVTPRLNGKRLLNVGGGSKGIVIPSNWIGWEQVLLDVDDGPDVDIVLDAKKLNDPRTVPGESFDAVYCSHTLEHFHSHEVADVLAGFNRVLKPGGQVEVWVPNVATVAKALAEGKDLDDEAYASPIGPIKLRDILYGYGPEIEKSGNDFYWHRTGFTPDRLEKALTAAGFTDITVWLPEDGLEYELRATAIKPDPEVDTTGEAESG
jgi:SAM-dependent methyltransferase